MLIYKLKTFLRVVSHSVIIQFYDWPMSPHGNKTYLVIQCTAPAQLGTRGSTPGCRRWIYCWWPSSSARPSSPPSPACSRCAAGKSPLTSHLHLKTQFHVHSVVLIYFFSQCSSLKRVACLKDLTIVCTFNWIPWDPVEYTSQWQASYRNGSIIFSCLFSVQFRPCINYFVGYLNLILKTKNFNTQDYLGYFNIYHKLTNFITHKLQETKCKCIAVLKLFHHLGSRF